VLVKTAGYSQAKRAREAQKAKKAQEKRDKKARKKRDRDETGTSIPVAFAEDLQSAPIEVQSDAPKRIKPAALAGRRLFVGGLSWDTDERMLSEAFTAAGAVEEAVIITDRDSGRSRGFGFVTMSTREEALAAIEKMDGEELDGRRLKVSIAVDRR
jgi:RNA recognition motif-containing protein